MQWAKTEEKSSFRHSSRKETKPTTWGIGALSSINGAARLMKEASPTPTNLKEEDQHCI